MSFGRRLAPRGRAFRLDPGAREMIYLLQTTHPFRLTPFSSIWDSNGPRSFLAILNDGLPALVGILPEE